MSRFQRAGAVFACALVITLGGCGQGAGPPADTIFFGDNTWVVDIGANALLPGFIDAHGHVLYVGASLDVLSLHPPPVGDVENIDDIVRKIRAWIEERDIPPGETVSGSGYDDSLLEEGRHPTGTAGAEPKRPLHPQTRSTRVAQAVGVQQAQHGRERHLSIQDDHRPMHEEPHPPGPTRGNANCV